MNTADFQSWKELLQHARKANTKNQWNQLFEPVATSAPKWTFDKIAINKIFQILKKDRLSLNYNPQIWSFLLQSCIFGWDMDLAFEISNFCVDVPNTDLSIIISEIYLNRSLPCGAREIAKRGLKIKSISEQNRILLKLIVINSYADQRNLNKVKKDFPILLEEIKLHHLGGKTHNFIAKIEFSLGKYLPAAENFELASHYFRKDGNMLALTRSLFNTAVAYDNHIMELQTYYQHSNNEAIKSYYSICNKNLKESQILAKKYDFPLILYANYDFLSNREIKFGNYHKALSILKKAQALRPRNDGSIPTLDNLSMQLKIYLQLGSRMHTERIWKKIKPMFDTNQNTRYRPRYVHLESDYLWEKGYFEQARTVLIDQFKKYKPDEQLNLTDWAFISHFFTHFFITGELNSLFFEASEILKKTTPHMETSSAYIILNELSKKNFSGAYVEAANTLAPYLIHSSASIYTAKIYVLKNICVINNPNLDPTQESFKKLQTNLEAIGRSTFDSTLQIILASQCIQKNDNNTAILHLKQVYNNQNCSISDKILAQFTIEKLTHDSEIWPESEVGKKMLYTLLKLFFPTIKIRNLKKLEGLGLTS